MATEPTPDAARPDAVRPSPARQDPPLAAETLAARRRPARRPDPQRPDPSRVEGARPTPRIPRFVQPELATLVERVPEGEEWLHEIKFDGYRIIARLEAGVVEMYSRNDRDWTEDFRVLADELAELPVESALLDGEVAVRVQDGTTSFQELRRGLGAKRGAEGGASSGRLMYYVFDLLYLDGYDLLAVGIEERRRLLGLLLAGRPADSRIAYSEHIPGGGGAILDQACEIGLEGIVSKKAGTPYRPGARGPEWVKSKCRQEQEFFIGGFTDPTGTRVGFGALLLGVRDEDSLRYVGKVGTGFDDGTLRVLGQRLRSLETDTPPFTEDLARAPRHAHWVRPELVVEVGFAQWTPRGGLRHPSFKGLRDDKPSGEVVAESPGQSPGDPAASMRSRGAAGLVPPTAGVPGGAAPAVTLTHPDKVFWPLDRVTKRDLAEYYARVAAWMLPYVIGRPLSLVRCPGGVTDLSAAARKGRARTASCFFHKHPGDDFPGPFRRVTIRESAGPATYLVVTEAESLTALAQMATLEIHIWGSTWPDIEHPDLLVFDLDPDPAVSWPALAEGARLMRDLLRSLGLESFVKTTGGKGLHVVAPITPAEDWEAVRSFCRAVAKRLVEQAPDRYTANMSKAKRGGKIYIDYVRNNRGATSIAPYSTRARDHPTVAVPLRWSELSGRVRPDTYTLKNLHSRLSRLKGDPWDGYFDIQRSQKLTRGMREAVGRGSD